MLIYLIRHGDAGSRRSWEGDDAARPLSRKGLAQSDHLVAALADRQITSIVSSPFLRCFDTVKPLAERLALKVEMAPALGPDDPVGATEYLRALGGAEIAAVCTHGEVIGHLLTEVTLVDGLELGRDLPFEKGSFWELERLGGRFVRAAHTASMAKGQPTEM